MSNTQHIFQTRSFRVHVWLRRYLTVWEFHHSKQHMLKILRSMRVFRIPNTRQTSLSKVNLHTKLKAQALLYQSSEEEFYTIWDEFISNIWMISTHCQINESHFRFEVYVPRKHPKAFIAGLGPSHAGLVNPRLRRVYRFRSGSAGLTNNIPRDSRITRTCIYIDF